ncbi:hypothetical protein [Streptomyces parvulus]|uniref:Uncharacterized protein n=1 Tax=Streptomyces parvulus TaxID=146923 RepID=A0A369UWB2_9ACTN|nr:hypothetical protein [Streptomyces parvulus]RDD85054.1 hypothetical protein DVZ84_31415 [Streptomyces parvulus]
MEPADLLARYGVDPARLDQAPDPPARPQTLARVQETPPRNCVVCGAMAATARAVDIPLAGARWVDMCWEHHMAVLHRPSRGPGTLEGIAADLRAAALEAGLPGAANLKFYPSIEAAVAACRDGEPG